MSWLEMKKEEVIKAIHDLAQDYIGKLSDIWFETLDRKKCEEHLTTMIVHTNTLYDDILQEQLDRRDRFLACIAERQEEAANLSRLLKVDVMLSPVKGLPLHTALLKIENSLQDLRCKLKQRKDEIIQLLLEQETLCNELGETPRELLDDPLPTEFELQDFRDHLKILNDEKLRRIEAVNETRKEIRGYMADLEIMMDTTVDSVLLNDSQISLTESTLDRLRKMRDDYRQQVDNLRDAIDKMRAKLDVLWNYLEISPSVKQKFAKYTEYSQTTYDKFYQELERCENQKRQNIKQFIDRIRADIVEWWNKTMQSQVEQARFVYFTSDCYTEDLLTLHEMKLEDLKHFYYSNQKIFELIEQRKVLWDRMAALEAKASEPGRYNNRGGQLLKEEKERKTIATKLPKIEAELTELVSEFENAHKKKFLVYGEDVLESIARDWETKKAEKEKLMSARKNAVNNTPISRTPLRTPLSVKNHSTMKRFASSTNISTQPSTMKRKLLHPESLLPNAKRSLMHDLGSPRSVTSKTPFKSPAKKTRVIATTIKRKSGRASGNSKNKRRSAGRTPIKLPRIKITKNDNTASENMSYNMFEDYIDNDPTCRSSIVVNDSRKLRTNSRNKHLTGAACPTPSPRGPKSPINSPAACSSRKLTTKNLPILI